MKRPRYKYYLAGTVSLIVLAVYLACLQNDFVNWDDREYLIDNPYIRSFDLAFLRWAFSDFYAANWHPVTWISHALDYALWGLNPWGHHLTSVIIHAVNAFVVVLLVARLTEAGRKATTDEISHKPSFPKTGTIVTPPLKEEGTFFANHDSPFTLIAAATTGLLFGLHPLHVESVAWVAERKDVLCALFFLLSITAYTAYVMHRTNRTYLLCLISFTLALLSKPMAVSMPLVLLVLDWYPLRRITSLKTLRASFVEKLPFFMLSVGSSILTILAQNSSGAIRSWEIIPAQSRAVVAAQSLVAYLWKMVAPLNLLPLYTYPRNISFLSLDYFLPVVLVFGITLACIAAAKKQKLWISAWGYYVITLIPVLGIVQVGGQSMADRYTYLPSLGPFFAAGLVAAWGWEQLNVPKSERRGTAIKWAAAVSVIFVFVSMTYLTINQIGIWKNSIELWSYVIEKEPAKVNFAYYMRGQVFQQQGHLDKALRDYDMVNTLEPFHFEVYYNCGSILEKMGQSDKAIEDYSMAITINPRAQEAYISRGILYGKAGLFDEAIKDFNKGIEINPNYPPAYVNRGTAYSHLLQDGRALADFTKAIDLDQNYAGAYVNRGSLYLKTGNKEQALSDYRKACSLGDQAGCDAL